MKSRKRTTVQRRSAVRCFCSNISLPLFAGSNWLEPCTDVSCTALVLEYAYLRGFSGSEVAPGRIGTLCNNSCTRADCMQVPDPRDGSRVERALSH